MLVEALPSESFYRTRMIRYKGYRTGTQLNPEVVGFSGGIPRIGYWRRWCCVVFMFRLDGNSFVAGFACSADTDEDILYIRGLGCSSHELETLQCHQ